jgi:hypothetical protein
MLLVSCAFARRLKFRVGCKSWTETSSLERWSPGQVLPYRMRLTGQFEVVIITRLKPGKGALRRTFFVSTGQVGCAYCRMIWQETDPGTERWVMKRMAKLPAYLSAASMLSHSYIP